MKEILEIIERNPKIPPKEIATMTGLTEAQVASKIREMEGYNGRICEWYNDISSTILFEKQF